MALKFRPRNYRLEEEASRAGLPPRRLALDHPLATASVSSASLRSSSEKAGAEPFQKIDSDDFMNVAVNDPLGIHGDQSAEANDPLGEGRLTGPSDDVYNGYNKKQSDEFSQQSTKEWANFMKALTQKFSHSTMASDILPGNPKVPGSERFSEIMSLEGTNYPEKIVEDEEKILMKQDYMSRLKELKIEICRAWQNEDRNTSLKLSIKAAKILSDVSVFQFYPVIFVLVAEILDMLGELVWDRIKRKSEWTDDGKYICALPDDFVPGDISFDAKELCYNWFAKVGSIHELLPRIYLELAILRCWRFLKEESSSDLQRLTLMMRGLSDSVASAYCHLYMVHRVQGLDTGDIGYLLTSINDISSSLRRIIIEKEVNDNNLSQNKRLIITLLEPVLEWIMKALLRSEKQNAQDVLIRLGLLKNTSQSNGFIPCLSIVLHYLLRELPGNIVLLNSLELLELIECSDDITFEQHLNYRFLGLKLSESQLSIKHSNIIAKKILPVIVRYNDLGEYLAVLEAYFDIILQNTMDSCFSFAIDGVLKRAESQSLKENGMDCLLSILLKVFDKFNVLEDVLSQKKFIQIFDLLNGYPRITASRHILNKVTRDISIKDPRSMQFLFEVSKALHDAVSFSSGKDGDHAIAGLVSRFVQRVDLGDEMEANLKFLVECRVAFRNINELKVYLVHSSNALAIKAIKNLAKSPDGFVRACIAFSEVTMPSILDASHCLSLYLETAEVALSGGFVSHVEGLVGAAITCLESIDKGVNGPADAGWMLSSILKLCSLLIMVPCTHVDGASRVARRLLSAVDSRPWATLAARVKLLCAVIFLLTTLSQRELPYRSSNREIAGNDELFFGDEAYMQDLTSSASLVVRELVETIERGVCTPAGEGLSSVCSRLMNVARSCLPPRDKYLQSTAAFLVNRTQ